MTNGAIINTMEQQRSASQALITLFVTIIDNGGLTDKQANEVQIAINELTAANKAAEYHISQFDNYEKECG